MASSAQSEMDQYGDQGFQYIKLWSENDYGQPPSVEELAGKAAEYNQHNVANLSDPDQVWPSYEIDYGIPSVTFLGPDMTVLAVDTSNHTPSSYIEN